MKINTIDCRLPLGVLAAFGLGLLLFAGGSGLAQVPSDPSQDIGNIFPAAPRELRQNLSRAQAAIADERFSDAADELGQILDNPASDDYFLGRPGQPDAQQSLKTEALALIGSMPAKGRQVYETKFGFDAKAELDKALEEGSLLKLTEVSRRYFHTKAGYEATLLVGRTQLDQGRPLAAALTLKRITDSPVAAAQYDPELTVLLATCWVHARMPQKATEALVSLRQRNPQAKVRLLDGEESLFSSDDQALAWLERIVGGGRTPLALVATQWVLFRGNEARNATTQGGVPLLNYRWSLPTINEPQDELKVKSLARSMRDSGQPNIVALQPLVVQDTAIIRAPDSSKLLGVDMRTGKRTWVFPPFDANPALQASRAAQPPARGQGPNLRDQELRQRVWDDHAFGQIASDGRYAYVLDDLGYANPGNMGIPSMIVLRGGRGVPNSSWSRPHNLLVALDLKREGYQVWAVGGTEPGAPGLLGAFFLGPPLPLGDQLFALAEINSEIRLVSLNSATGALEWKQQLAVVEDYQQITSDRVRRLAGASPSFADGILICPTSAGAVVAIDLATRSLRWGYQYRRWDWIRRNTGAFAGGRTYATPGAVQGYWLDSTATIADGCVIITPVESEELHCLDLLTGKAKWPPQPRDDSLFVACVHKGKIVLVGSSKVRAVNLGDGKAAWTAPIDLATDKPAGRGFYTDKYYYLPLSNQQLAKIDLDEGRIVSRVKTEIELGNVVCYKDQLVSQSALQVASFFLTEPLLAWIDTTLKTDPDNAKALSLKAQVLLQEGQRTKSLALLRRAVAKDAQDLGAKSLLVKVMISLLRDDFAANFALAEELDKLVTDSAQRREILRWRAMGLAKAGKSWEAFETLVALADQSGAGDNARFGADVLESAERDLAVRPDRWLQGQLSGLVRVADSEMRARMSAAVQARLDSALRADNAADLREFVNRFGFHPLADQARLALADKLVLTEQLLEAELLAGELLNSADESIAGHARSTLAELYHAARRFELSSRYYAELNDQFADVVCREGLTGRQLAMRAPSAVSKNNVWPVGRADVTSADGDVGSRAMMYAQSRYQIALQHHAGAALPGMRAALDSSNLRILVRDDQGRQLANASLSGPDNVYRRAISSPFSNLYSGKVNGHLLVVNLGDQLVAIDALRAERSGSDGQLWKLDAAEIDPTNIRLTTPQQRSSSNPLAGNRYQLYDPSGRMNFYTGPVQSIGVCFQKGRQLVCVDPLTGAALWERSQIPAAAEIFGDPELIFVADPTADEALVLSALDGSLLGRRKVERADRRWATHGRRVLAWEPSTDGVTVKLYDAWEQGAPLWTKKVALGSRGTLVDSSELALLEPDGNFTVLSLATGQVRFVSPLAPEPSLAFIHVLRSRQQYILIASQEIANEQSPQGFTVRPVGVSSGYQQNRVHGRVYAFDCRTGKSQWQVPAFVAFHGLLAEQPLESPLLFFARNKFRVTQASSGSSTGSVLCLDRRDGRIVWDSESETESSRQITGQINYCDVIADVAKRTVTVGLLSIQSQQNVRTFTFQLSDQPVAPQPPAQTGDQSSRSVGEMAGAVDRSIDAAFDLLRRGLDPTRRVLPGGPQIVPPAVPPAPRP